MQQSIDDGRVHDALADWIDDHGDAPDTFADDVADAWSDALLASASDGPTSAVSESEVAGRRRRWRIAVSAGLAAAALVLLSSAPRWLAETGGANAVIPSQARADAREGGGSATERNTEPNTEVRSLPRLRAQMREVLAARCVPCHMGGSVGAEVDALGVFDVSVQRWWTSMSPRQRGVLRQRLTDSPRAAPGDASLVDAFVAAESASGHAFVEPRDPRHAG
ncbi:MAG: hypothetical protein JKY37_34300 [Nannocystaceae bacterium]|nr:hypothetical protein [Nannocystaceae bacterium]